MRWMLSTAVLLAAALLVGAPRPARAQDPAAAMDARRDAIERWHEARRAWLEARREGLLDLDPVEQPGPADARRVSRPRPASAAGASASSRNRGRGVEENDYADDRTPYGVPGPRGAYAGRGAYGGYPVGPGPYDAYPGDAYPGYDDAGESAGGYFDTPACVALRRAPGMGGGWALPAVPGFALEARCGLSAGYGAPGQGDFGPDYGWGAGWGQGPAGYGYGSAPYAGYGYGYGMAPYGGYGGTGGYGYGPSAGYGYGYGSYDPRAGYAPEPAGRGDERRVSPHRFYRQFHPDAATPYPGYGAGWGWPGALSDCALVRLSTPEGFVTLRVRPALYGAAGPAALGAVLRQRLVAGAGVMVRSESGIELRVPPWTPVGELRVLDCAEGR